MLTNKKVLLRNRKRGTVRGVASLVLLPGGRGGRGWGSTPVLSWLGGNNKIIQTKILYTGSPLQRVWLLRAHFFLRNEHFWLTSMLSKSGCNEYHLQQAHFYELKYSLWARLYKHNDISLDPIILCRSQLLSVFQWNMMSTTLRKLLWSNINEYNNRICKHWIME